ncbi:hypothetical protein WA158_000137 [Blastocystis sp. Blastoise]
MSATNIISSDENYLFTFQNETQLWISREFMEKYSQLPFLNITQHSEKYEDGSYYIDMLPFQMQKVISFLMEDNMDFSTLNLRDSCDIYEILDEYSVVINDEIQSDLLFHIRELFFNYLKDNNYEVYYYDACCQLNVPMQLFDSTAKTLVINDEYASNIPLEYIYPSCIKDIFPSLEKLKITVITNYMKTDFLLNPNTTNYMKNYIQFHQFYEYQRNEEERYDYYTISDMKQYNEISSLDINMKIFSSNLVNSYNEKREKNQLPKLYECIHKEAVYINDYSEVEGSEKIYDYSLEDTVELYYCSKTDDKIIHEITIKTEWGISQLLRFPSYFYFSEISLEFYSIDSRYNAMYVIRAFEEGSFDSITALNFEWMCFPLSSIKRDYFPKLHTICYYDNINMNNFDSKFPKELMSMIDTIDLSSVRSEIEMNVILRLYDLIHNYSIHIIASYDVIYYFPHNEELIKKGLLSLESQRYCYKFEYEKYSTDQLILGYNEYIVNKEADTFIIKFKIDNDISIKELKWIDSLFRNDTFNHINELIIKLPINSVNSEHEYFSLFESILRKILLKASKVELYGNRNENMIERLVRKGCFHNTIDLNISIEGILDSTFFDLYTQDNFSNLKQIKLDKSENEILIHFLDFICLVNNNDNFLSSTIIYFKDSQKYDNKYFYYNPSDSILPYKYNTNLSSETISIFGEVY